MTCLLSPAVAPSPVVAQSPLNTDPLPLDGALVAFTPAAQDRILLYDTVQARTRVLRFGRGWHYAWGFSPDGCRLLFTLGEGSRPPLLYSARLDGTDVRPLLTYSGDEPVWGAWEPVWALNPDGSARIAFTLIRIDADGARTNHIAWVDGGAATPQEPQFYSVSGDEFNPQWSPDGAWLAYVAFEQRAPGADPLSTAVPTPSPFPQNTAVPLNPDTLLREADLWVVASDGGVKYRLTYFDVGSVRAPRWSPDGALISFVYAASPNNDTFWIIANQRGAIPTALNQVYVLALDNTWLPDSSALLVSARSLRGVSDNRLWQVGLLGDADSAAASFFPDGVDAQSADYPRFSADGRWLAFRSAYRLGLYDVQNGALTWIDGEQPGNTPPFWSPAAFAGEQQCAGA